MSLHRIYQNCMSSFQKNWVIVEVAMSVTQSCPPLCDPMDCSPPGSSVHGILQARILEWVATAFSRGPSWPRDQTWVFCKQADSLPSELQESSRRTESTLKNWEGPAHMQISSLGHKTRKPGNADPAFWPRLDKAWALQWIITHPQQAVCTLPAWPL